MSEFRKPQAYKSLNASSMIFEDEHDIVDEFLGSGTLFYDLLETLKSLLI